MTFDLGSGEFDATGAADDALAALDAERRKLGELGKFWSEASTKVRAKDQSLEMTFDGRGELVELTFNGSKYRSLAPAQLARLIVDTIRAGRVQAQEKMAEIMGTPEIPGLDVAGLAAGRVGPEEMIEALIGPMVEGLAGFGIDAGSQFGRTAHKDEDGRRDG